MKYIIVLLLFIMFCAAALAQQVPHPAPMSLPKTNTELKAINGGINLRAARLGFTIPGDGGYAEYNWSATNCTAADNGAQVQPSVTGCWIADFSNTQPTPMVWGAKGDGTVDDHDAVQAAIIARQGDTLWLGERKYKLNTGVISPGTIHIVGAGGGQGLYTSVCQVGLFYGAANIDLLTLNGPDTLVERVCIDGNAVANTGGRGIYIAQGSDRTIVADSTIYQACVSIEVTASGTGQIISPVVRYNTIVPKQNVNCRGVRVGSLSTSGRTTEPMILYNHIYCGGDDGTQTSRGIGVDIGDSGGMVFSQSGAYGCNIGTRLMPGAGQINQWGFFYGTLGDTSGTNDLLIDTAASNAVLFGNSFIGTWASTARNGANVKIQNTAGSGNISGHRFSGHRTYIDSPTSPGFEILAGNDFKLDNSVICSPRTVTAPAVLIGGVATRSHILNNVFGACDQFSGALNIGVRISTTPVNHDLGSIRGNDFTYIPTPLEFTTVADPILSAIITDNRSIDNIPKPPVASATNIVLPMAKTVYVSGAITINTMTPAWTGREIRLIALDPAGLTLAKTSGDFSMCNTVVLTQNQQALAYYEASSTCWLLN